MKNEIYGEVTLEELKAISLNIKFREEQSLLLKKPFQLITVQQ